MSRQAANPGKAALGKISHSALLRGGSFVGGRWVVGPDTAPVLDPATLLPVFDITQFDIDIVEACVHSGQRAMRIWQALLPQVRGGLLRAWAAAIRENRMDLATIITVEQGKPLNEAHEEVAYGASFLDWFAAEGERFCAPVHPAHRPDMVTINTMSPVGLSVAITPWNFPLAMITRKAGAALAAGCATIVKPAPETPLTANALAVLAANAGIPPGVFQILHGDPEVLSAALLAHSAVRAVSFTGSTRVGRILLGEAAKTIKRTSMELGGNAPFIVFADADIDAAVSGCMAAKFATSGQDCLAANRVYVHETLHDIFVEKLATRVAALRVGHGLDQGTDIGPMTVHATVKKCQRLLAGAVAGGAEVVTGATSAQDGSNFVTPTVLRGVDDKMDIAREEIFAPLVPVMKFIETEEVIARANATEMGLAAYIYTPSLARAQAASAALEFGMVAVNTPAFTGPPLPFGGWKQSGLGREGSISGIYEYLENKSISFGGFSLAAAAAE